MSGIPKVGPDNAGDSFPSLRFKGKLRPSQEDVVKIARQKLAAGKKRLHIVAPPGSGKTVLGLFLWAECVKKPALVLSPNSAIQAQWAARADLFETAGGKSIDDFVTTNGAAPSLLTSLTYQAVTLPKRGDDQLDSAAFEVWRQKLIETAQAQSDEEAAAWIEDLKRHNSNYYEHRLGAYRKQARDALAQQGQSMKTLHDSARNTLARLAGAGVGLVILDECHHLLGHWGRVLADARELLEQPIVVGLTATPPDLGGKASVDVKRYAEFFGEVDYEVPTPAVVKDGFLAPYQDLAYFVRPTAEEMVFVAKADDELHAIVADVCAPRELIAASPSEPVASRIAPLPEWVTQTLALRRLPTGPVKDWSAFERRDPQFADAARLFLIARKLPLPPDTPDPESDLPADEIPEFEILAPLIDRYVRHALRRSPASSDHELAERITRRMRLLGVQITETGAQACASPVGRVMAYSRAKLEALAPILHAEHRVLGPRLRAVIVADYEKTSAVSTEVANLLDAEAGGAVAAFKALLADPICDSLNPILVTGSSVLVDEDVAAVFDHTATKWLAEKGYDVQIELGQEDDFHAILGSGADWAPRVYVEMITEFFQRGLTQCLVGTRGLLGEGWDAHKVNVLIDLTTVTTSMSVNQLRGRSFRLDPADPEKLADNWDVVCLAPEFTKGLDDYHRFIAKHQTLFGVTDDGAVEKGVGHVHPSFTKLKPEGLENAVESLNAEMLSRVGRRQEVRERWKIGEPYRGVPTKAVEARPQRGGGGGQFPPFGRRKEMWTNRSLAQSIGAAVLESLCELGELPRRKLHIAERAGGYVRLFLEQASREENDLFSKSLHEALGPLRRPRYVIPRYADIREETWLSRRLPDFLGRYLQKTSRRQVMLHAVPALFAKNKETVAIFEKHWREHVSPGEAVFALRETGAETIEAAREAGITPSAEVHEKEIFL